MKFIRNAEVLVNIHAKLMAELPSNALAFPDVPAQMDLCDLKMKVCDL
jgi:hypothetical protein